MFREGNNKKSFYHAKKFSAFMTFKTILSLFVFSMAKENLLLLNDLFL